MNNEKQNNNNIAIIITITSLIIIIIGLIIYIIYSHNQDNHNNTTATNTITDNQNSNNNNDNQPGTTITTWYDYILSQDITSIKLKRTRVAMSADEEDINKEVTITKKDLTTILGKLNQLTLVKRYSIGMGIADGDTLTIKYNKEGSGYTLSIPNGVIFTEQLNDTKLKKLLEDNITNIKDEQYKNQNGSFCIYEFDGEYSPIYDSYFE